jgi:anti-sigma regulatory factor (Ser/Thr protein kinase)/putative methionine-R-sulfoxide reductase with GAF domain
MGLAIRHPRYWYDVVTPTDVHSRPARKLGVGQVALELDASVVTPARQLRDLVKLSDPALSELSFQELLDELLERVRDLLSVDTAAILLLDPDRRQLVATAARGIEEEVEQGVRIPIGRGFAGRIAQERIAIFIADVDHADVVNPILREKGICSLLGVPLIVEGDLIGVLHVGSLTRRRFDLRDLAVLELAAARAAPAIERSRLITALAREHANAVMLQRSLLPRRFEGTAGIGAAARYLPAREEVGGDWYDLIDLGRGEIGIAIGDVVGHGLSAATLMGQLRTALHAYALEGHSPGRTLELVDRFARSIGESAMATAAYVIVNATTGVVRLASAGHLPPVVIPAAGRPRLLEVDPAPPIGAFDHAQCPEREAVLEQGSTLLLYTDGLVERPRVALSTSLDELLVAVAGAQTPEDACLLAVDRLVPQRGPRDDIALIAIQNEPVPERFDVSLPAHPQMLSQLRRMLGRWLAQQPIDQTAATEITIAVSEACSNAVEHAYGIDEQGFRVRARLIDDAIEVTVTDRGSWRPPRGENRGRGLRIMQNAMDGFEIRSDPGGTSIVMTKLPTAPL